MPIFSKLAAGGADELLFVRFLFGFMIIGVVLAGAEF
jgi:hypothetical protein